MSTLLKDFSSLEADVTSHGEAVLQGRLSKSQQRLIRREQLKNCAPLNPSSSIHDVRRKKSSIVRKNSNAKERINLQKSKSFRRFGPSSLAAAGRKQSEPIYKYRKNKTTNLDKLGSELNETPVASTFRTSNEAISYGNKYNESSYQNNGNDNAHQMTTNNRFCDKNQNERKRTENEIYSQEMKVFDKHIDDLSTQEDNIFTTEDSNKHINPRRKKSSIFQNVSSILKNIR